MRSDYMDDHSREKLLSEIVELRARNRELEQRLAESEQTLEAIKSGEVDAILISTKEGDRIFTLKGAEEPYRILFEQMNEGAITVSEDGGILYTNQSFARVMRTSLEKVFGSNIEDYIEPAQIGSFRDLLFRSTQSPARGHLGFKAKDGTPVPMQLSVSYLPSVDVPTYCIVAADLTERTRAEENLNRAYGELELKVQERTSELQRTSEVLEDTKARLETILTKIPVAVIIIEPPDGKAVFINEEVNRQFRCEAEPLGSTDKFLAYPTFHLDGRKYAVDEYPMFRTLKSGEPVLNEIIEFERTDGTRGFANSNSIVVKDSRGNTTAVIGLRFEITEQVEAERSLQAERNRLQFILDSLPVGVSVTDTKGRVLIRNKKVQEIVEKNPLHAKEISELEQFIGCIPGTGVPLRAEYRPTAHATSKGDDAYGYEIEMARPDGSRQSILCFSVPIIEDGAITGGIAAFVDISDQKNAEKALAHSNEELQQFAYVASHDLQEPLRMVISYLSLLERRYRGQLDEQANDYIDFAVSGGKRMKALIDDLLEYSRVNTQLRPIVPVDMNEITAKTLKNLELPIEESRAEIIVADLPIVSGDQQQLGQVLQNLISNALKFRGEDTPSIRIDCSQDGEMWVFSVKDNGIGLNMEYAGRIFHMFQRLHSNEQYEGTGVGLAIVKKIVERHGGKVWLESEVGKGATFFFSIPR